MSMVVVANKAVLYDFKLKKDKQAVAEVLALSGTARETAMEIPANDLNKDPGMDT